MTSSGSTEPGGSAAPQHPGPDIPAARWEISISVAEDADGHASPRAALSSWLSAAGGTKLKASAWAETDASEDTVRFQAGEDWASATRLPRGWHVLGAGGSDG
jgi:hypothetical protein